MSSDLPPSTETWPSVRAYLRSMATANDELQREAETQRAAATRIEVYGSSGSPTARQGVILASMPGQRFRRTKGFAALQGSSKGSRGTTPVGLGLQRVKSKRATGRASASIKPLTRQDADIKTKTKTKLPKDNGPHLGADANEVEQVDDSVTDNPAF